MKHVVPSPSAGRTTLRFRPPPSLRSLLALATVGLALPVSAADVTLTEALLDSVNGFVNFSKSTLGSGANAIPNTLGPGDTVYLAAQTRQLITLVNLTQGTAANPINVTNSGGPFIIDVEPDATGHAGFRIWGVQNVHIFGTPGSGYDYGIQVRKSGVKVEDNNFHQGQVGGPFKNTINLKISAIEVADAGFAGIMAKYERTNDSVPEGETALLDGLEIFDCYIHDSEGEGMYIGQTGENKPDVANVSIHDNLLVNTGWDGIQLNRSQGNNEIYNNTILGYGVMSYTFGDGSNYFWQGSGFSLGRIENFKLNNNYVEATSPYSGNGFSVSVYDDTEIYNNVFVLGDQDAASPQPAAWITQWSTIKAGASLLIANNTIIEPEHDGLRFNASTTVGSGAVTVPVTIVNNIIAHPLAGDYVVDPPLVTPTKTTNLFVNSLAGAGFVGGGDYHLAAGSAAIDAGTTVGAVSYDFDYNARPAGAAYDIGAYEYATSIGVLTPAGAGQAGGAFCPADGAFNEQPTWNSSTGEPQGIAASPHIATGTSYANRFWYVDFGPNWQDIRITQMWTRYRPFSGGDHPGFATFWWDDDTDTTNDGTTANGLNFASAQDVPNVPEQLWIRDSNFGTPVVPQGRYLVVGTGATVSWRPNEFLFVGYVAP